MSCKVTTMQQLKNDLSTTEMNTVLMLPGAYTLSGLELTGAALVDKINENSEHIEREYQKIAKAAEMVVNDTGWTVSIDRNFYGDALITRKRCSNTTFIRRRLIELRDEGDYDDELEFDKNSILRPNIYLTAKRVGVAVTIELSDDVWIVRKKKPREAHPKHSQRGANVMGLVTLWLEQIPYNEPTEPPAELIAQTTDSYLRTALNQGPYHATYRKGYVTKYRASLHLSGPHVSLTIGTENPITISDIDNLNWILPSYNLALDDVADMTRKHVIAKLRGDK